MAKLKIPTLQHLARNWNDSPEKVEKALLDIARSKPPFSYDVLNGLIYDHLALKVPREELKIGIERREKRENIKATLIEVLTLVCDYFEDIQPNYVHRVMPRYYSLHREVRIEFRPPILYAIGGQIYFPWFSYWRTNALSGDQLSLFVTLVEEMLLQDPDLENARFQILDCSADSPKECRKLRIIDASDVPRVDEKRKLEMLAIFWEGFQLARSVLEKESLRQERPDLERSVDQNQIRLID